MIRNKLPVLWLAAVLLAGCSYLGLQKAESFSEKLAYSYAGHKAVIDTATNAVATGALSVEDAKEVYELGVKAKTFLDSARTVYAAGDTKAADAKLLLAAAVLSELNRYLAARGVQ